MWFRENQRHREIGTDLLQMVEGKIAAMISIKCPWNAAYLPLRHGFAPDALTEHQGGLGRGRRLKAHAKPGNGAAVIIHNDGQPGPRRRAVLPENPEI